MITKFEQRHKEENRKWIEKTFPTLRWCYVPMIGEKGWTIAVVVEGQKGIHALGEGRVLTQFYDLAYVYCEELNQELGIGHKMQMLIIGTSLYYRYPL